MALETVRIYSVDENEDPLEGVLVRVFDDSDTFISQNYTALHGAESYAEFTLEGDTSPITYTIRLTKTGSAFDGQLGDDNSTPQEIEIYSPASLSPTGANSFEVQAQTFSLPTSLDPRMCKCSGIFLDLSGQPLRNFDMHIISRNSPIIVDGKAILGTKIYGKTDNNGYIEVELHRNGVYEVLLQGLEDYNRDVVVPDSPSANFVHMLFPVIAEVIFDPTSITVDVEDFEVVELSVFDSSGIEQTDFMDEISFSSSDEEVVTVTQMDDGTIRVYGVSAGTAEITVARSDTSIVFVPDNGIEHTPLAVTVV